MKRISFILLTIFSINSVFSQSSISFDEHLIENNFKGISTICIADIDGDGLKDLVCGSETTGPNDISIGIWWMRNNGDDTWTRYEIDANFLNVMSLEVIDINGDGNVDVLASGWNAHQIAYWTSDGNQQPEWTKHIVKQEFYNAHDAHAIDINNDGRIDIIGCAAYEGKITAWYQQENGSFTEENFESGFNGVRAVSAADYNNDGQIDITAVAANKQQLAIFYNNTKAKTGWTKEVLSFTLNGAHEVISFDFDNDGDTDLLTSAYTSNKIDIWLNNGADPVAWTKLPVGTHTGVNLALPADFDNDGDIDIVATGKYPTSKLSIWTNKGDNTFDEEILNNQLAGFWAIALCDWDSDGDLDFFAGASVSNTINLYENSQITSVKKSEMPTGFIIFPNPSNGEFNISLENNNNEKTKFIEIFDIQGRNIFEAQFIDYQYNINIENVNKGIYFIKIFDNNNLQLTEKIMVE